MAKRRRQSSEHDADAFIRASEAGTGSHEELSEFLAEEFLRSATSGEEDTEEALDAVVPEELGGPFIESDAGEEFGRTAVGLPDDAEEERGAEPSAFPSAVGPLAVAGLDEREARGPEDDAILDEDDEEEKEEELQASSEPASDVEPDSEVLEPEGEPATARKRA
jgi:hypothetical protein